TDVRRRQPCHRDDYGRASLRFCFNDTAPTEIYTLSLHDALPILKERVARLAELDHRLFLGRATRPCGLDEHRAADSAQLAARNRDRKSTRLNSSHVASSYAVFCLKKKKDVAWLLTIL